MSEGYHIASSSQEQDGYAEATYSLPYIDTSPPSSSTSAPGRAGQQQDRQSASTPEQPVQQRTIPKRVSRLAATHKLGEVLIRYKHEAPLIRVSDVSSCLVGLVLLALFPLSGPLTGWYTSRIMWVSFAGGCILFYGISRISAGMYDTVAAWIKNVQLYLCTDGVMRIKRGRVQAMRWDQISTIQRIPGPRSSCLQQYILYPHEGAALEIDPGLVGFDALMKKIEREVTRRLLPTALTAYKAGQTLNFGPINVTPQGLILQEGQKELNWGNLGTIGRCNEYIEIREKGKVTAWESLETSELLNLGIFLNLISYIQKDYISQESSNEQGPSGYQPPANDPAQSEWQDYQ